MRHAHGLSDKQQTSHELLGAVGVSYHYPHAAATAVDGVGLSVRRGQMLAVLGNNGAGKSTLLDLLSGMLSPSQGRVVVNGRDLATLGRREASRHIATVLQQQRVAHLSVYDQVLLGRRPYISWGLSAHDRAVVSETIERLGLEPLATHYADELSGGERQKVFLARAIAQEPEVLLLDEPTSALDMRNQAEVLGLIRSITRTNSLATVLVIHDISLALRYCDCFLLMRDGTTVAQGDIDLLTERDLSHAYGIKVRIVGLDGVRIAFSAPDAA
ncbi:MAG: ABC transporter ATP-binding protein [Coriobacteriales bacterium]|jgi:iron complex transport system ATP-binding protein|nr:ABC transporter ATP-binding protein [Coriobacteriales bacterium]